MRGKGDVAERTREVGFDEGRKAERAAVVAWLRKPVPGTLCEDQKRDNDLAAAIERGVHIELKP